ncbi:hypothetical protein HIM_07453 [Hirsutella minnesotensis 3608]|uniref:Uncharacterized protein n=1 Tax=Hirsutella minnesotensis 3608 TaxID=1043627 RepID=A0A0F8A471_9HYPO|nr:hypothetical protein HIM_07453 [Hirsutella minnesotensis 3608]
MTAADLEETQLDPVHRGEKGDLGQFCQFVGGEGGTGKSRIIETVVDLFGSKGLSNRLLITATSGTAAPQRASSAPRSTQPAGGTGTNMAKSWTERECQTGGSIRPWPISNRLAGEGRTRHRRGEHARSADAARRQRATLPVPRIAARFRRDPYRPLLRGFQPVPAGPRAVDPPLDRGRLVGRRQLVQGRAAAPARQGARAVEEVHDGRHAGRTDARRWRSGAAEASEADPAGST